MAKLLAFITLILPIQCAGEAARSSLGWSSWNAYECDINATLILSAAEQVVELGLKDLGYEYFNIIIPNTLPDDCWSVKTHRDPSTNRMIPDPERFPDGISGVASQIHDLGLKVGIYSSAGETTCAGYPAGLGYEDIDAETFPEWGIDYLKYDDCGVPDTWADPYTACIPDTANHAGPFPNGTCPHLANPAPKDYDWSTSPSATRFRRMRVGNSWRISGDISPGRAEADPDRARIATWERIAEIANEMSFLVEDYAGFWEWPDADMLELGNEEGGLTLAENSAHFALWASMRSPLLIGTRLETVKAEHLAILKNKPLLTFHQDPHTNRPAYRYKWGYNADYTFDAAHPAEYWSGPSAALGGTLILMLNSENVTSKRKTVWSEVPELREQELEYGEGYGEGKAFEVVDAWTGEELGCVETGFEVELEAQDVAVLVVGEAR
ncbi:putative alpha-galactosidase B [Aspergillus multicolor]|uniref:glycoside hydrolase family 27 protein n=1 Tax=Aspergillus multicolor TaxID=41759 RepID=UPI003CCD33BE